MAKELPYFQFEPAEYLTKDISFCSLSAQGLFINICSFYWQRQCKLTKEQFLRRFNYPKEFDELLNEGIIDVLDNYIIIKFLDLQYNNATKKSQINSQNGSKGGRPKKQNETEIKPNKNQNETESKGIREDNIKEDEIKKDKIKRFTPPSQIEVIDYFNQNGYSEESAIKAFKYYETGQWKDGKGNQVKNWKQKMQSVWFKEDNKIKQKIEIPTKYNFI